MTEPLPVDPAEAMGTQSRAVLMKAHRLGLLSYREPVNMREPGAVQAVKAELEALAREYGTTVEWPTDEGLYYLVLISTVDERRLPLLIPEGEVRAVAFALAALRGRDTAAEFVYRQGMLPT